MAKTFRQCAFTTGLNSLNSNISAVSLQSHGHELETKKFVEG